MKGLRIPALRHRHLQTASQSPRSIAGSAPSYRGHLILESNLPASQWPSKVESLYPVLPALQNLAQDTSSPLYNFGFALSPGRSSDSAGLNGASLCLPDQQRVMQPQENIDFSKPVDEVVSELQAWIQRAPLINSSPSADLAPLHVFVCTHAARDCRCGTLGTSFLHELQSAVNRQSPNIQKKLSIREISHIGGHKYAANALAYPLGDWYGNLDPTDASDFMWSLLDMWEAPKAQREKMIWWGNWRGRLGLSAKEATSLHSKMSGQSMSRQKQGRGELGEAVEVRFETWDGEELWYTGFTGETLKDVAKRHDLVEAICGGVQECATCHVMLEGDGLPEQPEVSDDEECVEDLTLCATRKLTWGRFKQRTIRLHNQKDTRVKVIVLHTHNGRVRAVDGIGRRTNRFA